MRVQARRDPPKLRVLQIICILRVPALWVKVDFCHSLSCLRSVKGYRSGQQRTPTHRTDIRGSRADLARQIGRFSSLVVLDGALGFLACNTGDVSSYVADSGSDIRSSSTCLFDTFADFRLAILGNFADAECAGYSGTDCVR